jgi:hypothetical protein
LVVDVDASEQEEFAEVITLAENNNEFVEFVDDLFLGLFEVDIVKDDETLATAVVFFLYSRSLARFGANNLVKKFAQVGKDASFK